MIRGNYISIYCDSTGPWDKYFHNTPSPRRYSGGVGIHTTYEALSQLRFGGGGSHYSSIIISKGSTILSNLYTSSAFAGDSGYTELSVPGRRCPACLERGDTV